MLDLSCILMWNLVTWFRQDTVLTLNHICLQISQKYWCFCLTGIWPLKLSLMEGTEKPHTHK